MGKTKTSSRQLKKGHTSHDMGEPKQALHLHSLALAGGVLAVLGFLQLPLGLIALRFEPLQPLDSRLVVAYMKTEHTSSGTTRNSMTTIKKGRCARFDCSRVRRSSSLSSSSQTKAAPESARVR